MSHDTIHYVHVLMAGNDFIVVAYIIMILARIIDSPS